MISAPEKYLGVLVEIKKRTTVIDSFISEETHAIFKAINIEVICLQFRKILELIAFSSLIANAEIFSRHYSEIEKKWNARLMLRDLERINPKFYPNPIIQDAPIIAGTKSNWRDRPNDYLNKDTFVRIYEKCGSLMHAANPYASPVNYNYYEENFSNWHQQIINLLDSHTISLFGDENLYLFQMGATDATPTYHVFAPVKEIL